MTMEQREGKIFNLKPEMTLPMKLTASFAITYYGLLLIFAIITVVFSQYYIDSYYYNEASFKQDSRCQNLSEQFHVSALHAYGRLLNRLQFLA